MLSTSTNKTMGRPPRNISRDLVIKSILDTMIPNLHAAQVSLKINSPSQFYRLLRRLNILLPDNSLNLQTNPTKNTSSDFLS